MAAQPPTKDAKVKESKATGREDMAVLTSGARQKVDTALASATALGQQMLHPFDKNARAQAQEAANEKKQQATEKRDSIRETAQQQGEQGRSSARGLAGSPAGVGGENHPSARSPAQQGIHAPVEELDRADAPTSDKQHTTLGEMLAQENPEENPHIEHVEGNEVGNPHLDRNLEFRNPENGGANPQSNDGNLSQLTRKSDYPRENVADEQQQTEGSQPQLQT